MDNHINGGKLDDLITQLRRRFDFVSKPAFQFTDGGKSEAKSYADFVGRNEEAERGIDAWIAVLERKNVADPVEYVISRIRDRHHRKAA